ncbi:hypothetical protein BCR42DRAFT_412427 [Absidia repens]|uniref:Galactose oxidase n=1 Tax=Absidia repens TaxID=90262 RepID=A0A1X2IJL0_9FUNG|nr:hypothetical protein BCR42DRAFT_412427 [Absidia repens]
MPYSLTHIPWRSSSGTQQEGPPVYSQVAFVGGHNDGNMIIVGGVTPANNLTDEATLAYSYDCSLGRWNSFGLPRENYLNRQGAFATVVDKGVAYIWGGKRARHQKFNGSATQLPSTMYRLDSMYPSNSTIVTSPLPNPPLRYSHTQTLVNNRWIAILGGFDGLTGGPVSMEDIWTFDTLSHNWAQVNATLDKENKPANRSSHSQALMSDGVSILIYGGYDGYHVFNDVAVLDTRTWRWTVKNTNAAVQGRADHTATLVGNNMIVAFGFTGVSTSLTVMSDIEVLDVTTWSWTSYYAPSPGYPGNGDGPSINGSGNQFILPGTPSMAIVAGAVTGGLVVFVLIIVALYIFNYQQKHRRHHSPPSTDDHDVVETTSHRAGDNASILSPTKKYAISDDDDTFVCSAPSSPPPAPTRHSSLLPSPWKDNTPSSDWRIRRAVTAFGSLSTNNSSINKNVQPTSKPDEPMNINQTTAVKRAATTGTPSMRHHHCSSSYMDKIQDEEENNGVRGHNAIENASGSTPLHANNGDDDDDDDGFDIQEFILHSGEISSEQQTAVDGVGGAEEGQATTTSE